MQPAECRCFCRAFAGYPLGRAIEMGFRLAVRRLPVFAEVVTRQAAAVRAFRLQGPECAREPSRRRGFDIAMTSAAIRDIAVVHAEGTWLDDL